MANPRNFDVDFLEEKAREESAAKGDELISLVTSLTIKKKFEEDCEEEYKEAKRKHVFEVPFRTKSIRGAFPSGCSCSSDSL